MLNDRSTPLSLLATRRSGKPRELGDPGPSLDQLNRMIEIAVRTPDHGKLAPWRLVIVPAEARSELGQKLAEIIRAEKPDATDRDAEAAVQFATQAPALVVVLSNPVVPHKVPQWEQELSAGAVCMNLLHAANALGFVGGWLTGWAAYSDAVRDLFGGEGERIAGFVFIGTPERDVEERPRPELSQIVQTWNPGGGLGG